MTSWRQNKKAYVESKQTIVARRLWERVDNRRTDVNSKTILAEIIYIMKSHSSAFSNPCNRQQQDKYRLRT